MNVFFIFILIKIMDADGHRGELWDAAYMSKTMKRTIAQLIQIPKCLEGIVLAILNFCLIFNTTFINDIYMNLVYFESSDIPL